LNDALMAANSATALVSQASVVAFTSASISGAVLDGGSF